MKICIISKGYNPYIMGGGEIYVEKITKLLSQIEENEVFVITTMPFKGLNSLKPSVEIQNDIKIYRFYPLNIYHISYASKLKIPDLLRIPYHIIDLWNPHAYFIVKGILKKEKPDVVHINAFAGLSLAVFGIKSIPLVHTIHSHTMICPYAILICPFWKGGQCKYPKFPCKIYRGIKRKILYDPDIVTAPSKFVLDNHTNAGFFKESKKIVLPLGIELDNFNNFSKISEDVENFNILYVGGLSKIKGVHVLIEAFKKITQENVKLHIVGEGDYTATLKKLAKGDDRIIFYGKQANEEVQKFYRMTGIVVVPSICYENSPVVIYESLRSGTPVIGSNIGGIPELIKDNYNGFLFEPGNVKELKEILENIIESSEQLKELSKNDFESVKQYDMNTHVEKLMEIYREAIEFNNLKDDQ